MSTSLFSNTPSVTVLNNRGLTVREIAYHRHPDTPDITDERITRHQYDIRGFLTRSADPRLYKAGLVNFSYLNDLAGQVLRTASADAGTAVALNDAAGRPVFTLNATGIIGTFQYEDATLPGRPLSMTEQTTDGVARITERFVYAGNAQAEKNLNLAGQSISHYDTAGVTQTDSIALTGVPLSVTLRLLKDADKVETLADWQGGDASAWNDQLVTEGYSTQTTVDATGAVLTTLDAKGNQQRVAYDVAGLLQGSWLTLNRGSEQVIVKSQTYSAAGQKLCETHGNGVVTTWAYEAETQRLIGIKTERPVGHATGAKVLRDLRYEYDPVGNVLNMANDAEEPRFWRNQKVVPENAYVYDSLYQLVGATGREMASAGQQGSSLPSVIVPLPADSSAYTNYTRTYTYDDGGNLTQIRHSAPATGNNYTTSLTVSDRSNRSVLSTLTTQPSEVEALFSAGGQQKQLQPGQSLVWTPRGELLKVSPVVRDGVTDDVECYRYASDSQRMLKVSRQKTGNSVQTQRVVYLPGLELRTTATGDSITESLEVITVAQGRVLRWESGKPVEINNDQDHWRYDDLTGSSGLELDGNGNIISLEEYYPFGGTAILTARDKVEAAYKTIRYSGKERDATGLYYYGYRYYQPWAGRWLSADPAGTVDGLNLYRMVRNNPLTLGDEDGRIPHPRTRLPDSHLYQPKLSTGKDRDRPGASPVIPSAPVTTDVKGIPVRLENVLTESALKATALVTDLINPAKVEMDAATRKTLMHPDRVGNILAFNVIRVSLNENDNIHALRIVDSKTSKYQRGTGATLAYWAPQGGYVDIPAHPQKGQPELVFTPGFSGCTFVTDQLDENTLRVRHVQGAKEDVEYNNLVVNEHGQGMIDAMEYQHYGYHNNAQGDLMENVTGSAFMIYEDNKWTIRYQSLANAPGILSLKEESVGVLKKQSQLKLGLRYSSGKNVVNTGAISLHH